MKTATKNKPDQQQETMYCTDLAHGFQLLLNHDGSSVHILNENGYNVQIVLSEKGLSLQTNADNLHVQAGNELRLSAAKITLDAQKEINLKSKGNIITSAAKNTLQESKLIHKNVAEEQKMIATLGNVEIKASDDVKVDGERVLLNS